METFDIIVGITTILSFFVSIFALCQVNIIKKKIKISDSSIGNIQKIKGDNNNVAGRDNG